MLGMGAQLLPCCVLAGVLYRAQGEVSMYACVQQHATLAQGMLIVSGTRMLFAFLAPPQRVTELYTSLC